MLAGICTAEGECYIGDFLCVFVRKDKTKTGKTRMVKSKMTVKTENVRIKKSNTTKCS